jgi:phage-related protein
MTELKTFPSRFKPLKESGTRATDYKSVRVEYGDGYVHTRPVGLNSKRQTLPVAYVVDSGDRNELLNFLDSVGTHEPFKATYPGLVERVYLLDSPVNEDMVGGEYWRISFSVRNYYTSSPTLFLGTVEGDRMLLTTGDFILLAQQN